MQDAQKAIIDNALTQVKGIFQGLLINSLPLVEATAVGYLAGHEVRLIKIAEGAESGELTPDDVKTAIEDEAKILLSEVMSFEQIGASLVQDGLNNLKTVVIGIFQNAVTVTA